MPGLERFIAVLRLFDETTASWTVPAIAEALHSPQSTVYRTVRGLVAAGMLESATEARYRLGPAFIEFDRLIRLTDPLVRAGHDTLRNLAAGAGISCAALLSRLYNDTVMCIADEKAGTTTLHSSYERGKPMPLTQGATSKVILAHLPARRLNRLIAKAEADPRKIFAAEPQRFRAELAEIRRRGYCVTRGEIDKGLLGIAAPIVAGELGIVASLSLALPSLRATDKLLDRLIASTVAGADEIERALRQGTASEQAAATKIQAVR